MTDDREFEELPWRWVVLDSKGSPILQFQTEDKAREYEARGYVIFPVYKLKDTLPTHLCSNGNVVRNYPAVMCSMCKEV